MLLREKLPVTNGFPSNDFTEHDVFIIKVRSRADGNEELRAICILKGRVNFSYGVAERRFLTGPAFAMESKNGLVCLTVNASSSNFSPYIDSPPVPR